MSRRSGPTQAESDRTTQRVQLRLPPDVAKTLRRLAEEEKSTLAQIVTRWVTAHVAVRQ